MLPRLAVEALTALEQVAVGGPGVCRAARHLGIPEVLGRDLAVPRGEVELDRRLVVRLSGRLQAGAAGRFLRGRLAGYGDARSATR